MSKVFKTYIPALSMAFTFMILCATIYNIICGNTKDDFLYFRGRWISFNCYGD